MCKLPVQNTNLIGTIIIIIRNLCQYGGVFTEPLHTVEQQIKMSGDLTYDQVDDQNGAQETAEQDQYI